MHPETTAGIVGVFDIGGTWFRWGLYDSSRGLFEPGRAPAINYLSHPDMKADDLQLALADFIVQRVREWHRGVGAAPRLVSISLGAPVNAHDMTVLGSGPLWGPGARPFQLRAHLREALPEVSWHIINDVTALLARHFDARSTFRKTMLITVSTGIGSRLYDHRAGRIPYESTYGVQGEIGHLVFPFELDGKLVHRRCECGGWDHMNAFASGRGIAHTLRMLPELSSRHTEAFTHSTVRWEQASDDYRLSALLARLNEGCGLALDLLNAMVTPLSRAIAAALCLDPEIDRIVLTGGVVHGLGAHYRQALEQALESEGLYQITQYDTQYVARRLQWENPDDFAGLRGAGLYALRTLDTSAREHQGMNNGASN